MDGPSEEIAAAVAGWVEARGRPEERHPPAEQLAAYAAGEIGAAEAQRVEAHLVTCRECATLVLDLDELAHAPAEAAPADTVDALWQAVSREPRPEPARVAATPGPPGETLRRAALPRWPLALAAALLAATVGLSLRVVELRRTVGELAQPALNVPVVDLRPVDARNRENGEEILAEVAAGGPATLALDPGAAPPAGAVTVEISRREGGILFRGGGLVLNRFGSYTLSLPSRLPGEYRLRLFAGDAKTPFAEYALRIAAGERRQDG